MTPNAVPLPDGSLLLREVSPDEFGTYSCTASNHLGVALASSHVSMIGMSCLGQWGTEVTLKPHVHFFCLLTPPVSVGYGL